MILHLVNDEKFIDSGFNLFEDILPGHNKCVVLSEENETKFIKTTPYTVRNFKDIHTKEFSDMLDLYDLIVFHSLESYKLQVLKYVPKNTVIVWIGFGFDYYDLIVKDKKDLFDTKTKALFLQHMHGKELPLYKDYRYVISQIMKKLKLLLGGEKYKQELLEKKVMQELLEKKTKRELLQRITYFAPVLKEEYPMVKEAMNNCFKPKFIDWNYIQKEYDIVPITSNNILVGNSSFYENNHLEVFDLLKRFNVHNRKILTPLSYGNVVYRDSIINEGVKLFGDDFVPFIDFMPFEEYIQHLATCSIVIMNHIRQQALGNIDIMIYFGATVFLKQVNPIYKMYKNIGVTIFSIEELEHDPELLNFRLNKEQIEKNRRLLQAKWSLEVAREKTKVLLETSLNTSI